MRLKNAFASLFIFFIHAYNASILQFYFLFTRHKFLALGVSLSLHYCLRSICVCLSVCCCCCFPLHIWNSREQDFAWSKWEISRFQGATGDVISSLSFGIAGILLSFSFCFASLTSLWLNFFSSFFFYSRLTRLSVVSRATFINSCVVWLWIARVFAHRVTSLVFADTKNMRYRWYAFEAFFALSHWTLSNV